VFRSVDAFLIPFTFLWCGMVIAMFAKSFTNEHFQPFSVVTGVFVLFGIYIAVGRYFVDSAQRARTRYGVTNQRILILSGSGNRNVKSLLLRTLGDISLQVRESGKGTITFGPIHPRWGKWAGTGWPIAGSRSSPMFDGIDGARAVFELIREAQRESHRPSSSRPSPPTGLTNLDSSRRR
jgi:hypothetical protein